MRKAIVIIFLLLTSCANYKYNKGVKERNEIIEAVETQQPIRIKTHFLDYLMVIGLYIILTEQIKKLK